MPGPARAPLHPCLWPLVLAALGFAGEARALRAQERADEEPFLPGLLATFRDEKEKTATRIDHQLSFHWGESAPDPRLTADAFRAVWQGQLLVASAGEHRFHLFGSGEVELKVAGRVVIARRVLRDEWCESAPVTLAAEPLPFELAFRRTEKDARLAVFWSGPQFGLEPIPPRFLAHPRERTTASDFERGQVLSHALRCGQCHAGDTPTSPAPALDHLAGNVSRAWLVEWLKASEHAKPAKAPAEPASPRRMPAFGLSAAQAEAIADWLLPPREQGRCEPEEQCQDQQPKPDKKPPKLKPDARAGERLFVTLGCLACHTWQDLGASGWFGGGDLTHIGDKRPATFFSDWLSDPARLNRDHRMPVFQLSADERTSLSLFLAAQKSGKVKPEPEARASADQRAEGKKLIEQFRCASCHHLPEADKQARPNAVPRLSEQSNWQRSCAGEADAARQRPGYRLSDGDARALRVYHSGRQETNGKPSRDGRLLLAEHNCLACHAREGTREAVPLLAPLLADKLAAVAQRYPDLAPQLPALLPPALNSVGDKLTDSALADAVGRRGDAHRTYQQVRMPRFPLDDAGLKALVQHLVTADRIPPRGAAPPPLDRAQRDRYLLAGGRLVSSDGFGCTSCHQVGSVLASDAPLNARGPGLSHLDRRIRREWFDRWVRNPARIVPRMEMPSVQLPIAGALDDNLDRQLDAVWYVLNLPGFEPPAPNPIRTLRHNGNSPGAEPLLLTDVLQHEGKVLIKPFLVGLANRHNVLLDLEAGGLGLWTTGDVARQRTKGKTWFWELAGTPVLDPGLTEPDLTLVGDGRELKAQLDGQFVTEADAWQSEGAALTLSHRLHFKLPGADGKTTVLHVQRLLAPLTADGRTGFVQELTAGPLPAGWRLRLRVLSAKATANATLSADRQTIHLGDRFSSRVVLQGPADVKFAADGTVPLPDADAKGLVKLGLHYLTETPLDRFPELPVQPFTARKGDAVEVAPGFVGERLPLPLDIMPTGLAWRADGRLVFSSLRGQVLEATDTDRDGGEDRLTLLADGLPAPYGVQAGAGHVDVIAKYALLRVRDAGPSGRRVEAVASGWGYTPDYHDWAVGLPRTARGEYLLGIPCQQDKRSPAAARFRGNVLRLVPRAPTGDDPRLFSLESISAGHRFPMGLALDRHGELFVTDNQGNYNPFNELNHVRPGVHFGFINTLDRDRPAPPLTPPAIDIPHPWTRSVNGICFLDTPGKLRASLGRDAFGPLEGHLVGCEYDTRRLVRMTLQRVGDTYQGAAYPLSILPQQVAQGLMGPVVCAVSPRGELYVGSMRDSGWGAGNNVGEIVRVRVEPEKLPCGISEVRATRDGFTIDFFRPVDRTLAGRAESYSIQSYRRQATPAYGGPDIDRRTEKVAEVGVAADGRRATLKLAELRPGFVYELRLKNLAPGAAEFHPSEAHYTLRVVPK